MLWRNVFLLVVVKGPAFTSFFIWSGLCIRQILMTDLNYLCFPVRLYGAYLPFIFQVTCLLSTLLTWPNTCIQRPNNCWGRFYSCLRLLQAAGGKCGGGWPQTSMCQRSATHASQGHIIFKACRLQHAIQLRPKKKADILHSWGHSTKYNNFLEFFDPRRRSQGTSCCPCSTSCSCSSVSLPRCHDHWKTYSRLIGTLTGNALVITERRVNKSGERFTFSMFASSCVFSRAPAVSYLLSNCYIKWFKS